MLSIVVIAKQGTLGKDGINKYLADHLPTIQVRDGKPRPLSTIQVAEKVIDGYEAILMAATLEGETEYVCPTDALFIAIGGEFGIGELDPVTSSFYQDLECEGFIRYQSYHSDLGCLTFRTCAGDKIAEWIMSDGNYTSMHLSK